MVKNKSQSNPSKKGNKSKGPSTDQTTDPSPQNSEHKPEFHSILDE